MFVTSLTRVVARRALPSSLNSLSARRLVLVRAFSASSWLRDPTTATATVTTKKAPATKKASTTKKVTTTKVKVKAKPAATSAAAKKKKKAAAPAKAKKKAAAPKKKRKKASAGKKKMRKLLKTLTPEQREKIKLRYLKMLSLWRRPDQRPGYPWPIYVSENMTKGKEVSSRDKLNQIYARFTKLSAAEKQTLETKAAANREWNKREVAKWIKSYPVEVVYLANIARRRLVRFFKRGCNYIHDDRQPKRPAGAFPRFIHDRYDHSKSSVEAMKDLVAQWKSMSDAEKKPWEDQASAERAKCKGQFDNFIKKAKQYWYLNKPKRRPTLPRRYTEAVKDQTKQSA